MQPTLTGKSVGGPSGTGATTFLAKIAGTGITSANNSGIWTLSGGVQSLIALKGSPARGTNGEIFDKFITLADSNDHSHGPLFTAKLKLTGTSGIKAMRLLDGDPNAGGHFISLNLKKPIWLRVAAVGAPANPGVGTSVPEPSCLSLLGLLAAALLKRPRKV